MRVGSLLRRELGKLIQEKLRDPRVQTAVITDVDMSKDLSVAIVYTHSGEQFPNEEVCERLNRASGYLRKCLATRSHLRALPNLVFRADNSLEQGARMDALLDHADQTHDSDPQTANKTAKTAKPAIGSDE